MEKDFARRLQSAFGASIIIQRPHVQPSSTSCLGHPRYLLTNLQPPDRRSSGVRIWRATNNTRFLSFFYFFFFLRFCFCHFFFILLFSASALRLRGAARYLSRLFSCGDFDFVAVPGFPLAPQSTAHPRQEEGENECVARCCSVFPVVDHLSLTIPSGS